jgi:DNA segregation ATPase FtsK/SpoIIIE, S-DNA-T family
MALHDTYDSDDSVIPTGMRRFFRRRFREMLGLSIVILCGYSVVAMATWSSTDPSLNSATNTPPANLLGLPGAIVADQLFSLLGMAAMVFLFVPLSWAIKLLAHDELPSKKWRLFFWLIATIFTATFFSSLPQMDAWPIAAGLGGQVGDVLAGGLISLAGMAVPGMLSNLLIALTSGVASTFLILKAINVSRAAAAGAIRDSRALARSALGNTLHGIAGFELPSIRMPFGGTASERKNAPRVTNSDDADIVGSITPVKGLARGKGKVEPTIVEDSYDHDDLDTEEAAPVRKAPLKPKLKKTKQADEFFLPELELLSEPKKPIKGIELSADQLEDNARALEGVLEDFGVKGQIVAVKPGPVVTLYELEPAPGIKSSRVISLADDIARSMSAISARVAVVQGRNAIGIELPNAKRETVYLREMFQTENFINASGHLQVALGKNIGGEPIYADLARMPHLLIAGTTGSGKSVGINTLILSLLYRLPPDRCKLIMIDPKMLELSVYEGIPHLLAPVVTDPKKAVVALKWAVREMEER